MRRLLVALAALALVLSPLGARRAAASDSWCFDDPIVSVNGQLVDVRVTMPLLKLLAMRSTTLTVVIPNNVPAVVVVPNISVFPMKTVISPTGPTWSGSGPLTITVTATVSATSNYPLQLAATPLLNLSTPLAPGKSVSGAANTPLSLSITLGR